MSTDGLKREDLGWAYETGSYSAVDSGWQFRWDTDKAGVKQTTATPPGVFIDLAELPEWRGAAHEAIRQWRREPKPAAPWWKFWR